MQVNSVISVFVCLVFEYLTDILVVERVSVLSDFLDTGVKGGEERESSAELRGRQSLSPCNNVLWARGEVCEMLTFADMGEEFDQVLKLEYPKFGF